MAEKTINVDYVARVEGQGAINIDITKDGEIASENPIHHFNMFELFNTQIY